MESNTTNISAYRELLDVFRIGLIHGIIDKQDIISWADTIVQSDKEPDYFIIELSLLAHANEILALLNATMGDKKTLISGRVILSLLYKQLFTQHIDLKKAVAVVNWLVEERKLKGKDERLFYRLEEHYALAATNITGSMDAVRVFTFGALELYSAFTIDNIADWKEIDAEVDRLADGFSYVCL